MVRHFPIRPLFVLAIMLLHSMVTSALPHQYYRFNNLKGMTQKLCIRSMAQTEDGMIWFGTEDGLYSYNGYHLRKHDFNGISAGTLNYMAAVGDSILIGSERGLLSFNLRTYTFRQLPYIQNETVKGIVWAAGHWWVATENAIYQDGKRMGLSVGSIFSIGCDDNYLYIGTREQVLRYAFRKYTLEALNDNVWIATCFAPSDYGRVWIGMATAVVEWDWTRAAAMFHRSVPVAKSLCTDKKGNLLVGTDNGLYIVSRNRTIDHILHDARISESLAGDAVWSLFRDRDDNIWAGTDSGISMVADNDLLTTYTLPSLTGSGMGNQLFCIYSDPRGRYWMGGSNGLVCIENLGKESQTVRWYRIDSNQYPITHNRIRCVVADSQQQVWVGGDGGLFLLNEGTMQLERYEIDDKVSYWVYDIYEERKGELTVTTFDATYTVSPDIANRQLKVLSKSQRRSLDTKSAELEKILADYGLADYYLSAYHDSCTGELLLGATDRFEVLHVGNIGKGNVGRTLQVTDIQVNGSRWVGHQHIAALTATFAPDEGNLQFFLADFDYADELPNGYCYRLTGQEEWTRILAEDRSISLSHLGAGTYELYVGCGSNQDKISDPTLVFTFTIEAPWYATTLAKVLYVLLMAALLYGIYRFTEQRKQLKRERQERAVLVARAKEKERRLLSDNERLAGQLRLQLLGQSGNEHELTADEKFMLNITRIIEENMDDSELSVNTLSQKSGISTKQLYRRIKALTGMPVVAYIRDQRLKKAASLLTTGNFTVSEVMYMVGFSSASYFTRCFREEYGVTPSAYIEKTE